MEPAVTLPLAVNERLQVPRMNQQPGFPATTQER